MDSDKPIVELKGITKRFPGVVANNNVDLTLRQGEIHTIVGENGAGKTTLMNILYGLYQPDEGEIFIRGKKVSIKSPKDALKLGIGMVHQDLNLVSELTVRENIILGREPTKSSVFIDNKKADERIRKLSEEYKMEVDPSEKVGNLSVGERQRVSILRALFEDVNVILMDEPTSILAPEEKDKLIEKMIEMSKKGIATIPFVTHKLPEVMKCCDKITVMRDGRVVDCLRKEDANERKIAKRMVGRDVIFDLSKSEPSPSGSVLEIKDLYVEGERMSSTLENISFSINGGEILGIAGVGGNGQRELVESIMGLRGVEKGSILFQNTEITNKSTGWIRSLGISYVAADMGDSIAPELSIEENLILSNEIESTLIKSTKFFPFKKQWLLDKDRISDYSREMIEEFEIKTPSSETKVGKLSGGNIQRVILAREISKKPSLLIVDKPTKGLDVGSQEFIRRRLIKERDEGKAILLVSEDLDEVMMVSDKIGVMYDGEISEIYSADKIDKETIGALMSGVKV